MKPEQPDISQTALASKAASSAALRTAIETQWSDLRRGVEVLIWKKGLASNREAISSLAEDVLQEVVKRAWAKLEAYHPERSSPHAWLMGIATNILLEQQRRDQQDQRYLLHSADVLLETDTGSSQGDLAMLYDVATTQPDRLVELLDLVPPADRRVLTYRFIDNLTGPELAAALGVKEGAARTRLSRAVGKFKAAYRNAEQLGREDH